MWIFRDTILRRGGQTDIPTIVNTGLIIGYADVCKNSSKCHQYITECIIIPILSYLKNWPKGMGCVRPITSSMFTAPRLAYIHNIVQRQQIDVLLWVGHAHVISSKHEILHELPRPAQKHNYSDSMQKYVI